MKLEYAIHILKSYAGMTHRLTDNSGRPKLDQAIEIVIKELENSISKEKIKRKRDEIHNLHPIKQTETSQYAIDILNELLREG